MSSEERVKAEPRTGAFSGCLVEGDPETIERETKIKRRAVAISVVLQTAALAVFVIAPLFAKQPELVGRNVVPVPPYGRPSGRQSATPLPRRRHFERLFIPTSGPIYRQAHAEPQTPGDSSGPDQVIATPGSGDSTTLLDILDTRRQPAAPDANGPEKTRVHESHIDPALLTRRVAPVYPALARQTRRSGRVELHALIGLDGSVQSLSVVSGDPLFINSALDAVKQWHYRPTYLNGRAVEVDTYITVIYSLQ